MKEINLKIKPILKQKIYITFNSLFYLICVLASQNKKDIA